MGVGEMNKDQFTGFLVDTLGKAAACCRDGAIAFVFMDCPNEDRRPIICFHVDRLRAVLSNPSATRGQVAAAMEMGRNNRCFGT